LHAGLHTVVLVHLSRHNNTPDLARTAFTAVLASTPTRLLLAEQDSPGELLVV